MKNKYILLFIVTFGILVSVAFVKAEETIKTTRGERVKLLDNSDGLYLFQVDYHLYVANTNGGVIHAESCGCKK